MSEFTDYFNWLADGRWIRASARAIIFNQAQDQILIERNHGVQNEYANFIGGGVEVGETLQECIQRELDEESNAKITSARYLFVLENFIPYQSEVRHSLEHYFQIELEDEALVPKNESVEFVWTPLDALAEIDLRPAIVRNVILDGSFQHVHHLVFSG